MKVSIQNFIDELGSFTNMDEVREKFKSSTITTSNNPSFKNIVKEWVLGVYDEDIDYLVNEIENLK